MPDMNWLRKQWGLKPHAAKASRMQLLTPPTFSPDLSPKTRKQFVNAAIESEIPLAVIRRGAGPLHIGREYRGRMITRCGSSYAKADVVLFETEKQIVQVWKAWPRKCATCKEGMPEPK